MVCARSGSKVLTPFTLLHLHILCATDETGKHLCSEKSFVEHKASFAIWHAISHRFAKLAWGIPPRTPRKDIIMQRRYRYKTISFRVSEDEYESIKNSIAQSGLTARSYLTRAAMNIRVSTSEEIHELKILNGTFTDLDRQIRGMGTNINQLAHVANISGCIPAESKLDSISEEIVGLRKEGAETWQLIRSLIAEQRVKRE